jgi:ribosomal RNA-processing protein 9
MNVGMFFSTISCLALQLFPSPPYTLLPLSFALQSSGRLQRKLAHRVVTPQQPPAAAAGSSRYGTGRFCRAHRLSPTALALSADEATAFTVSKDGTILRWDLEAMKRTQLIRCVWLCVDKGNEIPAGLRF